MRAISRPSSRLNSSSEHAQGENITSGLRLKNVRCTVLTREEAVDAFRARLARGTDMNFWEGLLKQIAKCSLLTNGKREKERERGRWNGMASSGILYASQIFGPHRPLPTRLGNLHRRREKNEFWRKRRPRMKYCRLEPNGMFVRNRD